MIIDSIGKKLAEKTPNIRKIVRAFSHRLERTISKDNFVGEYRTIELSPALFRQKNLSKEEAKKLHGMVLEAFEHLCDPKNKEDRRYLNFKKFRKELRSFSRAISGEKHYIIKNKENNIVGFYSLKQETNSLYIQCLVLPKELRNTKKATHILKKIINNIEKTAQQEKYDKITLHVDSRNEDLVKSYKKFGFKIRKVEENFFLNEFPAYYMDASI